MSQLLKSLSYYIDEPLLIYDKVSNMLYQNKAFINTFYKFSPSNWDNEVKKLEYKMHFQVCVLDTENLRTYTPLRAAISSKLDFSTAVIYQKDSHNSLHFIIKTVKVKHFILIYFSNITDKIKCEQLIKENEELKIKNQEFAITAPAAQNQAVKMAILNRVATTLRNSSIDLKTLLLSSIKELAIIFGAHKIYFAKNADNCFKINYSYPENMQGEDIYFDEKIIEDIKANKINYTTTLKEHNRAENTLKQAQTRVIIPINIEETLFGIIVLFITPKKIEDDEHELLVNISNQISGSVLQVNLFSQISNKKNELEETLTELKATQLQLINSEKMASLGQLIANVAHEINTPLASISANNEIMHSLIQKSEQSEILKDMLEIDTEAIKRITNLVKSLKRFVRLDEGEIQQADINSELDLTLQLLHHRIKKGINIVKKYGEIPHISCYPSMLNQVFLNILTNALDAMKNTQEPEITIETKISDNNLQVIISNNGTPIEAIYREKLFEAGFTTKKVGEGTGLGLPICKKIIDKHKGKISYIPKGNITEFLIEVPIE